MAHVFGHSCWLGPVQTHQPRRKVWFGNARDKRGNQFLALGGIIKRLNFHFNLREIFSQRSFCGHSLDARMPKLVNLFSK